ncbi:hypothetical protein BJ165DRAFT_1491399 [Panaeolus papilionaceus]|nr:hypothetical protein BJ165DRAFT_1491399 [Panaeolus papilionaceus]
MNLRVKELLKEVQQVLLLQHQKCHVPDGRLTPIIHSRPKQPECHGTLVRRVLSEAKTKYARTEKLPNRRDVFVWQHAAGSESWSGVDVRFSIFCLTILQVVLAQYGVQAQKQIRIQPFLNHRFPANHATHANQRTIPGLDHPGMEFPLGRQEAAIDLVDPQKGLARVIVSENNSTLSFEAVVAHDPTILRKDANANAHFLVGCILFVETGLAVDDLAFLV